MEKKPTYEELQQRLNRLEEKLKKEILERGRIEEMLRKGEEKLRTVIEHSNEIFYIHDIRHVLSYVSPASEEILGYTSGEAMRKWTDLATDNPINLKGIEITEKAISTGERQGPYHLELRKKDGTIVLLEIDESPIKDEKGRVVGIAGAARDVTERTRAEKLLRESEGRFRAIFEQAAVGVGQVETETGRFLRVNRKYCDIVGYTQEEMTGTTFMEITHPDDLPSDFNHRQKLLGGEIREYTTEKRYLRKDGSIVWVKATVSRMWGVDEKPDNHIVVVEDITDRKRAEEALHEQAQILASIKDTIVIVTPEMKTIYANQTAKDLFGDRPEMFSEPCYRFYKKRETACENCPVLRAIKYKRHHQAIMKSYDKDGKEMWRFNTASPFYDRDGRLIAAIEIITDYTPQKMAELALRESEEKYRNLVEDSFDGIFIQKGTRIIFANRRLNEMLGYEEGELLGLDHWMVYHPDYQDLTRERAEARMRGEDVIRRYEVKMQRKDGSWFYGEINARPITFPSDGGAGIQVWVRDIMDQKLKEEALRESEEKYRSILENMEEGYYEVDLRGNFTFFNDSMLRIRGYSEDELMGMNYREYMDDKTAEEVYRVYHEVYNAGRPVTSYGWEITRRDGTKGYVDVSISLIKDSEGKPIGFRGVVRDVTEKILAEEERRRLTEQLHQAQKMESLGLMAGGIAHDLNNILSGIVGYPDLLLLDLPRDSRLRRPIEVIKESGMRAAAVVSDLLTIVRGVATGKEVVDLNSMAEEYLCSPEHKRLERLRPSVTFRTELDPDLLNIHCSPVHIRKSLMNLVINASEAIEGSGTVTISTKNRYLDEPLKGYEDVRQGEYAVLSVSDDGSGVSQEDLGRIFEPFYTKKVMGRSGTGLGLAIVWNTVQDHEGYIDIRSSEKGTVFELYFPVTRERVAAAEGEAPIQDYLGHGEKILVVDDEERQREIACGMLEKLGYIAEAVSSGEEAIEYVKEHPVDLILLDMIMPKGINGRETYEEIVKINPGQKAIIASGFSETEDVEIAQKLGAGKYIRKPYTLEKIGLAVKEELGK